MSIGENKFFRQLSTHIGKIQDILSTDENLYTSKCLLYRTASKDDETDGADPVFGYEDEVIDNTAEVIYGTVLWNPTRRKLESVGFLLEEGEEGKSNDLPVLGWFPHTKKIEVGDKIQIDVYIVGGETPKRRYLEVADISTRGRGSEATEAYLLVPDRGN